MISTARVSGLRLLDFSFGQCVYVSFETNITNHLLSKNPGCWRTQFMAWLDVGGGGGEGCLVKDGVLQITQQKQGSLMFNTLGGVGRGVGKNTEAATVIASRDPRANSQPQGRRSRVAGVFQAHRCPRRALPTACTVVPEPCGRHGSFFPERGWGEGVPRKPVLATYLRADPLGVAMP